MTRTRKFSTLLISAMALGAVVFSGGALSPNAPAAQAAQSQVSCNQQIITSYGQIPSKGTANTAANRNCIMGQGSQGNGVLALQLSEEYCYKLPTGSPPGKPDAKFGPVTRSSLVTIQGRITVTRDGVYGNNTHNKMQFWQRYQNGKHYCYVDPIKAS
ncbi:MAG: hypothetical protein LBK95_14195 [Bifidobacteriaceae bacterium]|jgi:peptidoglycan hydrolase-like protein with peptidoglycan-binding domain|nr:hypothetical protein [Bifidobacteriaceae bacterium]